MMYFAYTMWIEDIDDHSGLEKRHGGNQWGSIVISSHAFYYVLSLLHAILLIIYIYTRRIAVSINCHVLCSRTRISV